MTLPSWIGSPKSARIEIVNQSERPISLLYYNIDWIKKDSVPENAPYFYAQYRQEYPVRHGEDYVLLDTKGKGHYVGTVLAVRTRSTSAENAPELPEGYPLRVGATATVAVYVRDWYWLNPVTRAWQRVVAFFDYLR